MTVEPQEAAAPPHPHPPTLLPACSVAAACATVEKVRARPRSPEPGQESEAHDDAVTWPESCRLQVDCTVVSEAHHGAQQRAAQGHGRQRRTEMAEASGNRPMLGLVALLLVVLLSYISRGPSQAVRTQPKAIRVAHSGLRPIEILSPMSIRKDDFLADNTFPPPPEEGPRRYFPDYRHQNLALTRGSHLSCFASQRCSSDTRCHAFCTARSCRNASANPLEILAASAHPTSGFPSHEDRRSAEETCLLCFHCGAITAVVR